MVGSVDLSQDPPQLEFGWANGSGTTALIDEGEFNEDASDAYTGTVSVEPKH
jgi:hypothetical protein